MLNYSNNNNIFEKLETRVLSQSKGAGPIVELPVSFLKSTQKD